VAGRELADLYYSGVRLFGAAWWIKNAYLLRRKEQAGKINSGGRFTRAIESVGWLRKTIGVTR